MEGDTILILGAGGQIGTVLTAHLREQFGSSRVIASDIREVEGSDGPFELVDVTDGERILEVIRRYGVTQVYHLAAILSATGEKMPRKTWDVNMQGLLNVLEVARQEGLAKVFFPSTIAVFGPTTPRQMTANEVPLLPETVYGITKVAGENWCNYYHSKYGLDVRSVRYPGIVGHQSEPGGGTTDYAVEIYHEALKNGRYTCFLKEDTRLPMMFMDDAIRATAEIMEAPAERIKKRHSYNLAAMSFTPGEQAASIRKVLPEFEISYEPDFRQQIAESWSESIDDSDARKDWGWKHAYDLDRMTATMIESIRAKSI
jgi:threonine 3-dehydrogenase